MAVKDNGAFYPTDTIISKRGRRHYRVPVRSQHWQLRSLISAEKRHIVYFPGGSGSHHIQRLNTLTHECETIKLLTFAPRCLVAERSWLCCGSEKGDFVAIRLSTDADSNNFSLDLDPDARLPLGLDLSPERESSLLSLISRSRSADKSFVAKSCKMAKDRVNCITLWFPSPSVPSCDGAYTSPVAVLANNDRTVTLVSLEDLEPDEKTEPLATITYPDFVNRAIISPDGRYLIAILDDPYLYVHERTPKSIESSRFRERQDYRWDLKQRLLLKSQRKDDKTDRRGSFAACFSSSGEYLAVGTQHGTVSIFQTSLLSDVDANPLVTTFTSSHPESLEGAIRDMAFCPGPYDILAWTEDRSHIGIADIRSGYMVRQIVSINDATDFEHINILDRNTVDPQLLERRSAERNHARDFGSLPSTEQRRRGMGLDTLNHPLTTDETMVLEAIRGDRRRRERPNPEASEPTNQRSSSMSRAALRPTSDDSAPTRNQDRDDTQAVADLLSTYRVPRNPREALQERINRRRQMLLDTNVRPQTGRRNVDQMWLEQLAETVSSMRDGARTGQDRQEYLTVLELLQARERSTTSAGGDNDDASLLAPLVNPSSRWEESNLRNTLPDPSVLNLPPSPDNTAGLAWSADGRTLFVGAQNGIYEFQVNVQSRKYCPVITLR
ncbi:WD domain-containing protein [Sarocladium implicatum]|nr:WD domain-containing protein [Sarocladium implicatum]